MQKRVLNELSKQILAGKVQKDAKIVLDVFDKEFVFRNPVETDKKVKKKNQVKLPDVKIC